MEVMHVMHVMDRRSPVFEEEEELAEYLCDVAAVEFVDDDDDEMIGIGRRSLCGDLERARHQLKTTTLYILHTSDGFIYNAVDTETGRYPSTKSS
jgi:hypothetical protein